VFVFVAPHLLGSPSVFNQMDFLSVQYICRYIISLPIDLKTLFKLFLKHFTYPYVIFDITHHYN